MNTQEIKNRIGKNQPVTKMEAAHAISTDKEMLFKYLMDNNLEDVNKAMRLNLGHRFLPFKPDRSKMNEIIKGYINTGNNEALNTIIREFDFNPNAGNYTTDKDLLNKINFNPR